MSPERELGGMGNMSPERAGRHGERVLRESWEAWGTWACLGESCVAWGTWACLGESGLVADRLHTHAALAFPLAARPSCAHT